MQEQLELLRNLTDKWMRNEETTGQNVIWDRLVFGIPFTCICSGKSSKGAYFSRKMCETIFSFTENKVACNQGYREIIVQRVPEPVVYFNQTGEKLFVTSFCGGNHLKVALSTAPDISGGTSTDFDELPLYVLQNLAMQVIEGKMLPVPVVAAVA